MDGRINLLYLWNVYVCISWCMHAPACVLWFFLSCCACVHLCVAELCIVPGCFHFSSSIGFGFLFAFLVRACMCH